MSLASGLLLSVVVALLVSILVYLAKTGVPPVPSTTGEISAVVALLRSVDLPAGATIYDLGCGWGSLALGLACAFPEATIVGFEISPLPYIVSKVRARQYKRVLILRRDFREERLEAASAIVVYLGVRAMVPLADQLDRMLQIGTPVVTLCFRFRDRLPTLTRPLHALGNDAALYVWPARGDAASK